MRVAKSARERMREHMTLHSCARVKRTFVNPRSCFMAVLVNSCALPSTIVYHLIPALQLLSCNTDDLFLVFSLFMC